MDIKSVISNRQGMQKSASVKEKTAEKDQEVTNPKVKDEPQSEEALKRAFNEGRK